jgi:formylmethanofuran dehydrogenase subunit A
MSKFKIAGGTVYDPANGIDGQVRDLWIENGRIIAAPTDPAARADRTLDAAGLVVMPGGVDMHCHIAGPKVNSARRARPDDRRRDSPVRRAPLADGAQSYSGTLGSIPSTFATGYKYAGLGYTTAFDAAVPPMLARHAHEEFDDTPCLDKGFFVTMGNNHYLLETIGRGESEHLADFVGWLLGAARGYAAKIVNPGHVEEWKQHNTRHQDGDVRRFDEEIDNFGCTPRQVVRETVAAVERLGLPHAAHIHCNNLGLPGNYSTTLETMRAVEGRRAHFTHIQFHSYGGGEGDENTFNSRVPELAAYFNSQKRLTCDVGQVIFGGTTSMTGDGPVGYYLSNLYRTKWASIDTEQESGCGIAPIAYKNKSLVHALQWAIGLEWYLLVDDPWRVAMSTDHPNGGSFLAYPQIVRLLMDRTYRNDLLRTLPEGVRNRSVLADLKREYTLSEIAIITRAAPARMLGLAHKGHLGPGADADIAIYTPDENKETMFALPRYVIKAGETVIENGELRSTPIGRTLHVRPEHDPAVAARLAPWFEKYYSIRFGNYPVSDAYLPHPQQVPCRAGGME